MGEKHAVAGLKPVRVALVQMACGPDRPENLHKALTHIKRAAAEGAGIVCLQELFASQYFCQTENDAHFALAESIPGPTTRALAAAAKAERIVLVGSVFERRTRGLYHNTAVIFNADGTLQSKLGFRSRAV